jgi:hypothetical protein
MQKKENERAKTSRKNGDHRKPRTTISPVCRLLSGHSLRWRSVHYAPIEDFVVIKSSGTGEFSQSSLFGLLEENPFLVRSPRQRCAKQTKSLTSACGALQKRIFLLQNERETRQRVCQEK